MANHFWSLAKKASESALIQSQQKKKKICLLIWDVQTSLVCFKKLATLIVALFLFSWIENLHNLYFLVQLLLTLSLYNVLQKCLSWCYLIKYTFLKISQLVTTQVYFFCFYFLVNTESETAVVNVTYATKEEAKV